MPITAPPEKATSNALLRDVRAAFVVLTFAFVAICIPINPANADIKAPTTKDNATKPLEFSSEFPLNTNNTATAITKIDSTLYSAFKNAKAPSAICFAMTAILGVPTSCLVTQDDFINIKTKPRIPARGNR